VTVQREPVVGTESGSHAVARTIIVSVLADLDYNDGGMMRWHPSGEPTEQAEAVATRIVRELAPFLAKESHS
jgi:hypothetical protein